MTTFRSPTYFITDSLEAYGKSPKKVLDNADWGTDYMYEIAKQGDSTMAKLQIKLTKSKEGLLAQCLDTPEIIVVGKNKTEIKTELKSIIEGCVEAFPETKGTFYKNNKMVEVNFIRV